MRKVTISTSWVIRLLRTAAVRGLTPVNELLASPMNRWLYSTPNDQFGVKPYSNPTPDGAAPAGRAGRGQFNAGKRFEDAKAVARHRRTALYVEQRCVPGVADLAGEEADTIGFGASGDEAQRRGKTDRKTG